MMTVTADQTVDKVLHTLVEMGAENKVFPEDAQVQSRSIVVFEVTIRLFLKSCIFYCSDDKKWRGTLYSGVFFLFLFSTQKQQPEKIIVLASVIEPIKALSVVIRTKFKKNLKFFFPSVNQNRSETFGYSSNFEVSRLTLAYLCLV